MQLSWRVQILTSVLFRQPIISDIPASLAGTHNLSVFQWGALAYVSILNYSGRKVGTCVSVCCGHLSLWALIIESNFSVLTHWLSTWSRVNDFSRWSRLRERVWRANARGGLCFWKVAHLHFLPFLSVWSFSKDYYFSVTGSVYKALNTNTWHLIVCCLSSAPK